MRWRKGLGIPVALAVAGVMLAGSAQAQQPGQDRGRGHQQPQGGNEHAGAAQRPQTPPPQARPAPPRPGA